VKRIVLITTVVPIRVQKIGEGGTWSAHAPPKIGSPEPQKSRLRKLFLQIISDTVHIPTGKHERNMTSGVPAVIHPLMGWKLHNWKR
jgi:hypothetical protein